ncbi:MAG: tyrosine-type recombinase/integrase [Chloroflexi bacterium]|nr:tyrosine-type recombinase/integrase [Chloroflexota bacterium]
MWEELFRHPPSIERHRSAALAEERLKYLRHLRDGGFSSSALRKHAADLLRLVGLLDLTGRRVVSVREVEEAAREWSRPGIVRYHRQACAQVRVCFVANSVRWLRFLGWLEEREKPPRHSHTAEVAAFAAWARGERGYAEATVESCCEAAEAFFKFLAGIDTPLGSVSIVDVDGAIAAKSARGGLSRRTIDTYARCLKTFFRFAEDRRWCRPGIAAAITAPRIYVNEDVPARLKREDVVRLLATTEGDRPVDKRDRAILMLLAVYGLRSGELRGLQLDDVDWERETLRVRRPKPGRTHVYPLSRGVGQAIVRYLQDVRPQKPDRTLFLTMLAPFRPLTRGTLGRMLRRRLRTLGIVTGRRGPHALRHAAAQHLLDQGMAMKVIGDFLGHRSPSSTAVYAKIDLNALREVASFDLEGLA